MSIWAPAAPPHPAPSGRPCLSLYPCRAQAPLSPLPPSSPGTGPRDSVPLRPRTFLGLTLSPPRSLGFRSAHLPPCNQSTSQRPLCFYPCPHSSAFFSAPLLYPWVCRSLLLAALIMDFCPLLTESPFLTRPLSCPPQVFILSIVVFVRRCGQPSWTVPLSSRRSRQTCDLLPLFLRKYHPSTALLLLSLVTLSCG